ncbi:hypothetical protein [Aquipuribacter nitratireducens]|uniref:Integral membrane protein n=1 Tax=Aquipuribacter nitratireducens TaxID=650104 RepID=A0ABW0GJN3_9MICO
MIDPVVAVLVAVSAVVAVWAVRAARRDRPPSRRLLQVTAGVEVVLVVQAVVAVVGMVRGVGPEGSTVLFVSYLVTAVMVLPLALLWALVAEPDRWSSAVVAVAAFTVGVMVIRLWDLWVGGVQIGAPPGA